MESLLKDINLHAQASSLESQASCDSAPPSLEDQEKMLEFLMHLEQQRTSDPEQFSKTMAELGIQSSTDNSSQSIKKLTESIQELRSNQNHASPTFSLPNGNVLGSQGIQPNILRKEITPIPGFTVKTKRSETGCKVFINMCMHDDIAPPGIKTKLNDAGESVEGMNIPMSVGPARQSVDKSDNSCVLFDIIVNPIVIKESKADTTGKYRDFVCQLGIQFLEQKYKEKLDNRYKLPKLQYMGTVMSQWIQDRSKLPNIEEVKSNSTLSATSSKNVKVSAGKKNCAVSVVDIDLPLTLHWAVQSEVNCGSVIELTSDYVEPMVIAESQYSELVLLAQITCYELDIYKDVDIQASPYLLQVKVKGYKVASCNLPSAIDPTRITATFNRVTGFVSKVELRVNMILDRVPWDMRVDAGSKPWLMAQALQDHHEHSGQPYNPYITSLSAVTRDGEDSSITTSNSTDDTYAEDKFHIQLPPDVDQYSGVQMDSSSAGSGSASGAELDNQLLPEDRFHQQDASSAYIINQRDQAIKDKWSKHEQEKRERQDDPNVEYIDTDDFKVGAKYGPKLSEAAASTHSAAVAQDQSSVHVMRRAAEVVAQSPMITQHMNKDLSSIALSSNLWTELLD